MEQKKEDLLTQDTLTQQEEVNYWDKWMQIPYSEDRVGKVQVQSLGNDRVGKVQVQSLGNQNKGTKSSYEGQEENK